MRLLGGVQLPGQRPVFSTRRGQRGTKAFVLSNVLQCVSVC